MTTARTLSTLGRSRLLIATAFVALVASLTVALPSSAGATGHLTIGFEDSTAEVHEGDDGTVTIDLTVVVEEEVPPEQDIVFGWQTLDGGGEASATSGPEADYVTASGEGTIDGVATAGADAEDRTTITIADADGNLINGDTQIERDETFIVELTKVTSEKPVTGDPNAQLGNKTVTVTIVNDDVIVSVADASATEGQPGGFRVSLTDAAGDPVTSPHPIEIAYTPPTPEDGFAIDESPLTLQDASDALISFTTTDDDTAESDKTFTLELTSVTNAVFEEGQTTLSATGTILDDEPRVWISDVTQREGHSGITPFVFEVHVDPPVNEEVVVDYATDDTNSDRDAEGFDDSTEPGDYRNKSGTFTFPPESTDVQTISVDVRGDTDGEGTEDTAGGAETFEVQLAWQSEDPEEQPNISLDEHGIGTIVDDDKPTVDIVGTQGDEGDDGETPNLDFTIKLVDEDGNAQPAGADIILDYETSDGPMEGEAPAATDGLDSDGDPTSDEDADYRAAGTRPPNTAEQNADECTDGEDQPANSITIEAGTAVATLPIELFGDDVEEDNETFTVEISDPCEIDNPDLTIGTSQAEGKILDDDGSPTITAGDAEKVEGNSSSAIRHMEFPVRLSHPSNSEVTVEFTTDDGTATEADDDYEFKAGTLTFDPGQTEKSVLVTVLSDTKPERNETFVLILKEPANGKFPDGASQTTATGTIINDDGPGISLDDVTVDEGDSGTRDAVFRLTADTTDHDGFTVDVGTADGTATAGQDYMALPTETLTFEPGETSKTVAVGVVGDTDHEEDESFLLKLSNANFAAIVDGEGIATIVNDDEAPAGGGGGGGNGGGTGGGGSGEEGPDLGDVTRSFGATRIETALQVSRDHWDQAPDVVLATAATFPDALAGGTLSALLDAPLLLTFPDQLSDGITGELDRLGTQTVWILGGPAAVSAAVEQQLTDAGYQVHRFSGENRFATAAAIARGTGPSSAGEVVLTLGAHAEPNRAWPDALSAGALSAVPDPLPVLLTTTDSLPDETTSALADLEVATVYVLGGEAAVSAAVEAELAGLGYEVVRLAGSSRWGTSVATATEALRRHGDTGAQDAVLATGQNFPDGLAAGALAARLNGLLLLVPTDQLADETVEFLNANALRLDRAVIVGGEKAVAAAVADHTADALVADG